MKNKLIIWEDVGVGILKILGGTALSIAIPATFVASAIKWDQNVKLHSKYLNDIQSSTEFQEFTQNENASLEERLNNHDIEISEYHQNKDYIQTEEFVVNYAKDKYPDIYQGIIKSEEMVEMWDTLSFTFGVVTVLQAFVTGIVCATVKSLSGLNLLISSGINDFKNCVMDFGDDKKDLKKISEDIPEIDLE